jgi:uncharacterized protein
MHPGQFVRELVTTFVADLTCAFSLANWKESGAKLAMTSRQKLLRNFFLIIPQLLVFYCVLSPAVAMPLYNKMLFFPAKVYGVSFDKLAGVSKEKVQFPSSNNTHLAAWYFPVEKPRGVIIISHGNAGNISHRAPLIGVFLKQNFSVLAYDYQGYGLSEGEPSIDNICQDGLAAYDYLTTIHGVTPEQIVVYGESLGGGVTTYIANNRKVGAIILQSTFSSLPHIAKKKMLLMRLYPPFLYPKNKLDSATLMKEQHAPLLIVHGKADSIIPYEEAEVIFRNASEPKKLVGIENANHNDIYGEYIDSFGKTVSIFLDTVL